VPRSIPQREESTVEPNEWWHVNFRDWQAYAILDIPFSGIR
jgi:hypothetical protein